MHKAAFFDSRRRTRFIATNPDTRISRVYPACGALYARIEKISGRKAVFASGLTQPIPDHPIPALNKDASSLRAGR